MAKEIGFWRGSYGNSVPFWSEGYRKRRSLIAGDSIVQYTLESRSDPVPDARMRQFFVQKVQEVEETITATLQVEHDNKMKQWYEQDMGDESLRKMLKACNSLSGSSNDALESIVFEITAAMDRYLDGDEEKKWADRGGDQRVALKTLAGDIIMLKSKIEAEIQKGKERSTAFPSEELFMNIDLQLCALKSDTRCSDRVADLAGAYSSHLLRRLLNRLPVTDRFEQREKWARSVLVDLASERCFQIPVLLQGAGIVRWNGVASGVDGHSEATSAATTFGMNVARLGAAKEILQKARLPRSLSQTEAAVEPFSPFLH